QLLAVQILLRVAQALLHAAGDDRKAGAVQRLGDGGELGDHVLAVRALLEHAGDGAQLALGALETVDHRGHIGRIEFHDALLGVGDSIPRIYPRGCLVYPRGYMRCSMRTPRAPGPHRLAAPGARSRARAVHPDVARPPRTGNPVMCRYGHGIAPTPGGPLLLERIDDEDLSQTSYLIACPASVEASAADPLLATRV